MENFKVEVTAMNSNWQDKAERKSREFINFKEAYGYYCNICDDLNLKNAEYSDMVIMNHSAGGRGFDYRVELIVEE